MKRSMQWFATFLVCSELALIQGLAAAATPAQTSAETSPPPKSGPKISDLFPDEVVAKGKGVQVKRSQLDDAMVSIKSTFAARGQDLPPDETSRLEQQVLDRLIQVQILLQKASDADKATGKEICLKRTDGFRARAGSVEAFPRHLKSGGTAPPAWQVKVRRGPTAT